MFSLCILHFLRHPLTSTVQPLTQKGFNLALSILFFFSFPFSAPVISGFGFASFPDFDSHFWLATG